MKSETRNSNSETNSNFGNVKFRNGIQAKICLDYVDLEFGDLALFRNSDFVFRIWLALHHNLRQGSTADDERAVVAISDLRAGINAQ